MTKTGRARLMKDVFVDGRKGVPRGFDKAFRTKLTEREQAVLTRYYDELAEAQLGSRWVLTLTLAGAAEALANELMTEDDRRPEFSDELLASMKKQIEAFRVVVAFAQQAFG